MAIDLPADVLALIQASPDAEQIEYRPQGSDARTVWALVDRISDKEIEVTVANDGTNGIASDEINVDLDKVSLAMRYGETVRVRDIAEFRHDSGMLVLTVR